MTRGRMTRGMEPRIRELVRLRAESCCEYCRLSHDAAPFVPFHLEHVVARQHGGSDDPSNLAWSCHRCNAYKGPNLSGIDPLSGAIVPLFHPRHDSWPEHFVVRGVEIVGLTPAGNCYVSMTRTGWNCGTLDDQIRVDDRLS